MTEPQPPATEAEARARLAAAKSELEALVPEARAIVTKRMADAKARIAHARDALATWEAARAKLAPHRTHPEGAIHARRADLMLAMYGAMKQMMEIELAALEATGVALAVEGVPAWGAFKNANDDLRFHEQRRRMTAALAGFLWSMNAAGARTLQVAAGPGTPEDEAAAVRAAMAGDLNVERLVPALADELVEAESAVGWGLKAFDGWDAKGPDARRELLKDPHWQAVDGAVALLDKLHGRLGGTPSLTRLFPKPDRVDLPYAPPTEAKLPGKAAPAAAAPATNHDQVALTKGRASTMRLGDLPPSRNP